MNNNAYTVGQKLDHRLTHYGKKNKNSKWLGCIQHTQVTGVPQHLTCALFKKVIQSTLLIMLCALLPFVPFIELLWIRICNSTHLRAYWHIYTSAYQLARGCSLLLQPLPGTCHGSSHDKFQLAFHTWLVAYYYYNCFAALCPGLPGWAGTRRNIYPLTYHCHHPTFISFFHLLRSIASSLFIYVLGNLFAQPLSKSSFVYLLVWSPLPHTAHISLPIQCLLFATYAHTIAVCFAVVPRLYHLFLVSLSILYLGLYLLP